MLNRTADHALRAVLYLARQHDGGPVSVDVIAEALGAPRNYLGKTLQILAARGLLEGRRGPSGGYRLRSAPAQVRVSDILDRLDEPTPRTTCLMGDRPCDETRPCAAHARWVAVLAQARAPFHETTLADLLDDSDTTTLEAAS